MVGYLDIWKATWFISFLMSYTLNKESTQKSSVELLVYFLTDFTHFT